VSLGFFHPILRVWMQFRTNPPPDFWAVAGILKPEFVTVDTPHRHV
jgi:hypothetical protein